MVSASTANNNANTGFLQLVHCKIRKNGVIQTKAETSDVPKVEVANSSAVVFEGERVKFTCRGWGQPPPKVHWNTTRIQEWPFDVSNTVSQEVGPDDQVIQVRTSELILHSVDGTANGMLWCHADNVAGRSTAEVSLTIHMPPRITYMGTGKSYYQHIKYMAVALPAYNYSWYVNGRQLIRNGRLLQDGKNKYGVRNFKTDSAIYKGYLEFLTDLPSNTGLYTLVIENEYGADNRSLQVTFPP
ncbi:hypothetical protein V5799_024712, partial [Amblyomma americanum]